MVSTELRAKPYKLLEGVMLVEVVCVSIVGSLLHLATIHLVRLPEVPRGRWLVIFALVPP